MLDYNQLYQAKSKSLGKLSLIFLLLKKILTQLIKKCALHNRVQPSGYTLRYNCQLERASNYPNVSVCLY